MKNFSFESMISLLWDGAYLPLLLLCGVTLTIRCRALQLRRFGLALRRTVLAKPTDSEDSAPSPLQCAATALASTVGTGNIIGTVQAITLGGAGAVFWMWIAALLGMIVKYAEIALTVRYRKDGTAPMSYIHVALGGGAASAYALLAALSALGMGCTVQAGSIADALLPDRGTAARLCLGVVLASLTLVLMHGGAKRVGAAAERLVPFMAGLFLLSALTVQLCHADRILPALHSIVAGAFGRDAVYGGTMGAALRWGIRRGAFSNEAGLGSSALAHSASADTDAAAHGLWGIFEVFADTILLCTASALTLLCALPSLPKGAAGASLMRAALATAFGDLAAGVILTLTLGLFAFTTVMAWAVYGADCARCLFGRRGERAYRFLFLLCLPLGCVLPTDMIWLFADLCNALMSLPNLTALLLLSGETGRLSRNFLLTNGTNKNILSA